MSFASKGSNGKPSRTNGNLSECPYDRASIFSRYALAYMIPLFRKACKKQLTVEDIGGPPRVDHSRTLGLRLQQAYHQELISKKEPSLLRSLLKTFGPQLMLICILDFFSKCVAYPMQTVALGWLIRDAGIYLNFANVMPPAGANPNNTAAAADLNVTVPPLATGPAVAAIESGLTSDEAYWRIIYDAIILMLMTVMAIVFAHPFFFQTYHIGMKCRIAVCHMIYKKALRLSQSAMSETTVGQMVNLLSNDVNRFDQVVQMMPYLIMAPSQAAIILSLLSLFYLGIFPTLASLAAVLFYVLVQTIMGRSFSRFRSKTAARTDERVRLMNEIILAMRIIKMYAWEGPFKVLVENARRREITTIGIASLLKVVNQTLFFISSKVIVFAALITYVLLGYSFNPQIVFVSIGLANLVRISLTLFFPNAVAYCAETVISCRRINKFLMLPEIEMSPSSYKASTDGFGCKYVVIMDKVYASWASKEQEAAASPGARWAIVRNLSLSIRPKDLVLVVGRVGSGKSSVLMALLGELPIASGRLEINGRISYASQEPWIFGGTVRDNILFGKQHEPNRYNEVLRVCSIERDLDLLVDGDQTIVGERGVSLSGGQKARVNLARALYHEADIYILDDPLSAVDAPVAKHIFNESLRTFLRKKTVILATHQLQFLRHATKVLVVDRNSPAAFGTLQEVMESEAFKVVDYSKEAFEDATTTTEAGTDAEAGKRARHSRRASRSQQAGGSSASSSQSPPKVREPAKEDQSLIRSSSQASSNLNESVKLIRPLSVDGAKKPPLDSDADGLVASQGAMKKTKKLDGSNRRQGEEILSAVSSNFQTYLYYLSNASGALMFIWFILINIIAQGLYQYTDFFLSFWTDSVQRKEYQGINFVPQTFVDGLTTKEIGSIYAVLIALLALATFFRTSTFFLGTLRASINVHKKLFISVIHAPMTFFDFSPIGILLNRLSRDVGFVDETLPQTAIEIVTIFVNIAGIIVLAIVLDLKNLLASLVLFMAAFVLRSVCSQTVTRLKQIEGITRSPIFSHLSTTLSGLATIRSFKVQDEFIRIFDKYQDTHTSAWFNYLSSGRWLSVSMDWLCLIFIGTVTTLLLAFSLDGTNASLIGLLISQVVVLPGPFQWGMRQLIEVESQMTSVQRLKEFSELKSESEIMSVIRAEGEEGEGDEDGSEGGGGGRGSSSDKLLASYHSGRVATPMGTPEAEGEVAFVDLSLSYFPDEPPVLKSLSFTIRPREKVGIVGRTGAGKSSIVAVLFRLYPFEGCVELDGRDTKSMALEELRRSMSIIPQEPILFGGTIRKNLDPFGEHTDSQLWRALEAVQLRPVFARSSLGLDYAISEGGSNFSVGQRQLICLARAIVRHNKVLVLDEATANVDPETDGFIQRTIAQQFADCTVLTIAHRLLTIVDSDRVLVLDRGEVSEFGPPWELLAREGGLFGQMVESSGQQAPRIRRLIEEARKRSAGEGDEGDKL